MGRDEKMRGEREREGMEEGRGKMKWDQGLDRTWDGMGEGKWKGRRGAKAPHTSIPSAATDAQPTC